MEIRVHISEEMTRHLGNSRDDLHDFVTAENFRVLAPEVRKAVISKLMMLDEGVGQA